MSLITETTELYSGAKELIFEYLEPRDLKAVSATHPSVNQTRELGLIWSRIEESMGYPVDPSKSSFRNYNNFVKDLVIRIKEYPKAQVPPDIQAILKLAMEKAPTVAQACKFQEFIKARDTLVVWEKLASQAHIDVGFLEKCGSAEEAIERAKGLADWMNEEDNKERLQNLWYLRLDINQLTSIPKELRSLESLVQLDLDHNQLTSIPKELGSLESLRGLNLSYNQLTSIPKELGGLESLVQLNLSYNQLTSIPEELGGLVNLTYLFLDHKHWKVSCSSI